MATCASCGAQGIAPGTACPHCGAAMAPEIELVVPVRPPPKAAKPRAEKKEEAAFELAVDPRELHQQRSAEPGWEPGLTPQSPGRAPHVAAAASAQVHRARAAATGFAHAPGGLAPRPEHGGLAPGDVEDDARVLADYGAPPSSWAAAPFYAWRVLRRQRDLKTALAARRTEAAH